MNQRLLSPCPVILTGKQTTFEDDCACSDSQTVLTHTESNNQFEQDCACAASEITGVSHPSQNATLYQRAQNVQIDDLPADFHLAFSPYAPQGPSALNADAWERWQSFESPQPLTQPADLLLAEQNLIVPVGTNPRLESAQPELLTVWLHVTNACNLDCPYCYVKKSSAMMSDAVGMNAVEKVFETAQKRGFKGVKIKYAGGEATLHFRLIKKLSARAREISQSSGIQLQQVILSNGAHIRREDAEWIMENNARLMISLDGVGTTHDRVRPLVNGNGSFDAIQNTMDNILLPLGMRPIISVTITQQNATGAADAVRWGLARGLPVSLNFYRHPIGAESDLAAEEDALIEGMLAAYRVYEEILPTQPFLNGILDRAQISGHLHTCGVNSSYLVINHEGALAQCQMKLDSPVSRDLSGDLLLRVQHGEVKNISVDEKNGCQTCAYRYRCAGGCPLETYRASGRWDVPSPNCRVYKTLMPAALRLEGLRLLKENGYIQ